MPTPAEFFAAFNRYIRTHTPPALESEELAVLNQFILRHVPAAARLAVQLADGSLRGEPLVKVFIPLARAVERIREDAAGMEHQLLQARLDCHLHARPYTAEAEGTTATLALIHVAERVVAEVNEEIYSWAAASWDDDEPLHEYDVLAWGMTADALRIVFRDQFAWPDPAPLLHDSRIELMRASGAAPTVAIIGTAPTAEGLDDDPAPSIPMPSAARSKKKKGQPEDEPEPLPPPEPWPMYIVQKDTDPPLRVVAEDAQRGGRANLGPVAPLPTITQIGELLYQIEGKQELPVTDTDDEILQAFIDAPALSEKMLIARTRNNNQNAARNLRSLREKYDGYFADAIRCPGKKSKTGYQADVRKKV